MRPVALFSLIFKHYNSTFWRWPFSSDFSDGLAVGEPIVAPWFLTLPYFSYQQNVWSYPYTLTPSQSSHLAVFERFGESQHQDSASLLGWWMKGGQIVVLADCTALALRMGHTVTHGPNGRPGKMANSADSIWGNFWAIGKFDIFNHNKSKMHNLYA